MPNRDPRAVSRREFSKLAVSAAAAGPFMVFARRARASQKTLKIAKWSHFVPQYDAWFAAVAKEWGQRHDTRVSIESAQRLHGRPARARDTMYSSSPGRRRSTTSTRSIMQRFISRLPQSLVRFPKLRIDRRSI